MKAPRKALRLGAVGAAVIFILSLASPANAVTLNFECGAYDSGARVCVSANGSQSPPGPRITLESLEAWVGGDAGTLEGGCSDTGGAAHVSLRVVGGNDVLYYSATGNLCQSNGYSKTFNPVDREYACGTAKVFVEWWTHDNGGADEHGSFSFPIENLC